MMQQLSDAALIDLIAGEGTGQQALQGGTEVLFESLRAIDPPPALMASDVASSYEAWPIFSKIAAALELSRRFLAFEMTHNDVLNSPAKVTDYLKLLLSSEQAEQFVCLFLDNQNQLIRSEVLFKGTVNQTAVYPRQVVKRCLELNASSVIFAHNHPSGTPEPSRADQILTQTLKQGLALIDVQVLDHIIVAGPSGSFSFAQHGQI
jgi:DNA repair protein RadC